MNWIKTKFTEFLNNDKLKRKLYTIIFESNTPKGKLFDMILLYAILTSVFIMVFESSQSVHPTIRTVFFIVEYILTIFFTLEYLTRIYCSPNKKRYVLSTYGIIDLLATIPFYLGIIFPMSRYFMIVRAFRLMRVFRVLKMFSFIQESQKLIFALKASSRKIFVFFTFVLILVIFIGTVMFVVESTAENTQFTNISNSIYWAIVTMTTVGYGDITPVTPIGKFLSGFVMLIGYTIIAVPTGIVSASIIKDYSKRGRSCSNCGKEGHDVNAKYCKICGTELEEHH